MTGFDLAILQIVPRLDAGGAERTTLDVARAIVHAGGRALVASAGGRLADDIRRAGGEVFDMPAHAKNPATILRNADRIARIIREQHVDVVHARSRAPAWSALMACRRAGAPLVTTFHGAYRTGPLKKHYNSSMVRGDIVIANSEYTAARIRAEYPLAADRLAVIPRGVDVGAFDPRAVAADRIAALTMSWGVGEASVASLKLLLPARLTDWKGHDVAIRAAGLLKSGGPSGNIPELTLVFCGGAADDGRTVSRLRALARDCGVENMVHFVGDCADMPAAYAWSDIVLAPSVRPEAFGRAAIEAGAMERPVIASDHGGARETIIDGETGFLTPPGDSAALAAAVSRIVGLAEEERSALGKNGRARALSVYSSDALCAATLRVYQRAAQTKRRSDQPARAG